MVDKKGENYIIEVNGNPGNHIDQICKDSDIPMEYIQFVEDNWKNDEYRSADLWGLKAPTNDLSREEEDQRAFEDMQYAEWRRTEQEKMYG